MEKIRTTIPNKPLSTKLANLFVEINSAFGHAKELGTGGL